MEEFLVSFSCAKILGRYTSKSSNKYKMIKVNSIHTFIPITISLLIIYLTGVDGLQFKDCGSKTGKFKSITVSDCDTEKQECILKRNTTASIAIEMTLSEDVTSINTVVHGKIMGVEMPFNLPNPDGCIDTGLSCPLEKGESYQYKASLPVLKAYPKVRVEVKWELQDQNGDDIICILIPAKIQ